MARLTKTPVEGNVPPLLPGVPNPSNVSGVRLPPSRPYLWSGERSRRRRWTTIKSGNGRRRRLPKITFSEERFSPEMSPFCFIFAGGLCTEALEGAITPGNLGSLTGRGDDPRPPHLILCTLTSRTPPSKKFFNLNPHPSLNDLASIVYGVSELSVKE